MAEIGFYGFSPRPADPFIFNYRNMPVCKMLSDVETVMGHFVSGHNNKTLGAIGAGQVDRWGNVNSTLMEGEILLVGSGGANDVASGATETLVVAPQEKFRFAEKVYYITSPGDKVRTVVSDLGVFEKEFGRSELQLAAVYGTPGETDLEAKIRDIKERCGRDLTVREPVDIFGVEDANLLEMLRCYDPKGQFLGKLRSIPSPQKIGHSD
jgi:acyl CoA:acetate/3-ketoacid CoA transferase beta subunit